MSLMIIRLISILFIAFYTTSSFSVSKRVTKRSATNCPQGPNEDRNGFEVFLTMNAKASVTWTGKMTKRLIELNWTLPPYARTNDWVGLFRRNPMIDNSRPIERVNPFWHNGHYKTRYKYPHNPLLGMVSPESTCLFGFWIGYISRNRTLKANCLKIRPQWMWEEREVIGDIPLHALMIPGTHNSGAYETFSGVISDNIVSRYSVNQGEDIWNQLLYGVRYLDLRVGYYEDTPELFWSVHDFVKMNPLYEIIQDVRRFLKSTREIIILDFHRFPTGFQDGRRHGALVRYLIEELGEYMAPDWLGRGVTLNNLWDMNKTLILTYAHDPSSAYSELFWPEVRQAWGNAQNTGELKHFLDNEMDLRSSASYPWAAMTHLTPSTLDVVFNLNSGLRELSDSIARKVTRWYRDEYWNKANIIATDFFLGNNVIEESIIANRKRAYCRLTAPDSNLRTSWSN